MESENGPCMKQLLGIRSDELNVKMVGRSTQIQRHIASFCVKLASNECASIASSD